MVKANTYPAGMNQDSVVRALLTDAIKKSPKKRQQIAEELTVALGVRITEAMLNAYTSATHDRYRWPLAWTCAFSKITGDTRLVTALGECLGLMVCDEQERLLLELGRQYLQQKQATDRISDLEKKLKGQELLSAMEKRAQERGNT